MASEYGTWYGNFRGVKDGGCEFHLEPGPQPSRGWIVVADDEAKSIKFTTKGDRLKFSTPQGAVSIEPLYVESTTNLGPGRTRLNLVDRRVFWRDMYITRYYNVLWHDRQTFNPKTTPGALSSTGYTFREIVEDLLDVLSDVPAGYAKPGKIYSKGALDKIDTGSDPVLRNVIWEGVNAAEALSSILARYAGGTLSVDFKGNIVVALPGDDNWSAKTKGLEKYVRSRTLPGAKVAEVRKPKKLKVRYRVLREKLFKNKYWEAVICHDGRGAAGQQLSGDKAGKWDTIENVLSDWSLTEKQILDGWFNLKECLGVGDDKWKLTHAEHAKSQMYRYFRFKMPGTSSTEARTQILPFFDESGTYTEAVSGEQYPTTPYASDFKFYLEAETGDGTRECLREARLPSVAVRLEDPVQGIIHITANRTAGEMILAANVGALDQDYKLAIPTQIQVVMFFLKKFQSTDPADDYYYGSETNGIEDRWTGIADNGHTREVLDDSMHYVERDLGGTGSFTQYNQSAVDAVAVRYAEDFFRGYAADLKEPQDVEAVGYHPAIDRLCGRLRYISIMAGEQYITKYRINLNAPLNPFSRNWVREGGHDIMPETIRTAGGGFVKAAGQRVQQKSTGLAAHGLLELGPGRILPQHDLDLHPPMLLSPARAGIGIAWDIAHTQGGRDATAGKTNVTIATAVDRK